MWSNIFWTPKKIIKDRLSEYQKTKDQTRLNEFKESDKIGRKSKNIED